MFDNFQLMRNNNFILNELYMNNKRMCPIYFEEHSADVVYLFHPESINVCISNSIVSSYAIDFVLS